MPVPVDWSSCGGAEQEYLSELLGSMQDLLRYCCDRHDVEKEEGCDVGAASDCLHELANAFVLPTVSPCS